METIAIKVIVIKTKNNKALIGFSSKPKEFLLEFFKKRPQFEDLNEVTPTHFTAMRDSRSEYKELTHFYITSITDGETCWVSLNDNCMGFNDNH